MELNTSTSSQSFHPVVLELLKKRGLDTAEKLKDFLSWDLKSLPLLTELKDLEKASERIIRAIENNEKIGIYGDYDVDGTTSCALFHYFFKFIGVEVELIQPSRFKEGYGIHPPAIDKAFDDGIRVLITVDCGITNSAAAERALEIGIDLIITDHHTDALEEMPRAYAIVNPNRRDEPKDSPLKMLSGCAVAFVTCLQVRNDLIAQGKQCPSLYPLLQFVAIGTICDLVPLNSINLKLVRHGLSQIKNTQFTGIKTFFTPEERQRPIPSEKLGFHVGPLINSKGRLDHPEMALKLLIAEDGQKAFELYSHLEHCNRERKFITAEVYDGAEEKILKEVEEEHFSISIVYAPDWHEGVVGIVASRLVETFKVPAIVFTDAEEEGLIKGSARSAGELNIFDLLNEHKDLFSKFGGHKAAAGLSLPKQNLEEFKKRINQTLKDIPEIERTRTQTYDLEIRPSDISAALIRDLQKCEPFGNLNEKPLFKLSGMTLDSFSILKEKHVRWNFSHPDLPKKFQGISFNYVGKWGHLSPQELIRFQKQGDSLCLFFYLGVNHFRGNEFIQLMVQEVRPGAI